MIRQYTIKENDTLRDIARTQMGNPNRWVQIAIENNLDYPYIAQSGYVYPDLKVLYPGDVIMLTFSSNDSEKVYYAEHKASFTDYLELLMGVDIGLIDGQLSLVGSSDGIDLYLVKGTSNIKQAIINKFKVKKSTLTYYSKYGTLIYSYIGQVGDLPTLEMIKAEFTRTVLEDNRIDSVPNVVATFDGNDNISITSGLKLIGNFSESIEVRVSPSTIQMG